MTFHTDSSAAKRYRATKEVRLRSVRLGEPARSVLLTFYVVVGVAAVVAVLGLFLTIADGR